MHNTIRIYAHITHIYNCTKYLTVQSCKILKKMQYTQIQIILFVRLFLMIELKLFKTIYISKIYYIIKNMHEFIYSTAYFQYSTYYNV